MAASEVDLARITPGRYAALMFPGTQTELFAEYNLWMNEKLYAAAAQLTDAQRKRDLGAFFKSLHGTLDHILWR